MTNLMMLFVAFTGVSYAHEHHNTAKDSVKMSAAEMRADSVMQQEMAQHQQMEAVQAFPNYHPLVVHFPIVLLLTAGLFQILSFFYFKKEFGWTILILLAGGVLFTWLASNMFHADPMELNGRAAAIFKTHEQMASLTWWFSLAALIAKLISQFVLKRTWWIETVAALLLVASAVFVSIAGHHGAQLVYLQGIGPTGKYLDSYRLPGQPAGTMGATSSNADKDRGASNEPEEDHHLGERGKGPHGGTIEEADPNHMEIVAEGDNLVFYLLDGDAKPVDMNGVTGSVKIQYAGQSAETIQMMSMDNKLVAMKARNGKAFTAVCTLKKQGHSYSAEFDSAKDLPSGK